MKLLIVDDHPGVRALIRQLATPPADEVRECASGADAVHLAREFSPDVITMDVRLPDADGIEVTRTVRTVCASARVVIVTAYDQPALRQAADSAGAVQFLPKDTLFQLPALLAQLHLDAGPSVPRTGSEQK